MPSYTTLFCAGMQLNVGRWITKDHLYSNDHKKSKFLGIIGGYKYTFSTRLCHDDVNNLFLSQILLTQETPIFNKSDLSSDQNFMLLQKVNELLDSGCLRVSFSPYSSYASAQFVDNNLELLVDYNNLNLITMNRNYHVPTIQEVVNSITESNLFTKIVLKDAYHQLALTEDSKPKTAFLTDFGLFEFNVMYKNLKNADDFLQMLMDTVLDDKVLKRNVKFRLGEILIHTENFDHHLNLITDVLRNLRNANLKVDPDQSMFLVTSIEFLGYNVSTMGITVPRDAIAEIANFLIPQNKADIRIFLKLTNKYKNFILNFDQLIQPLTNVLNSVLFTWNSQQQTAFDNIKYSIISIPPIPFSDLKPNAKSTSYYY